jgi:hypothetical protein
MGNSYGHKSESINSQIHQMYPDYYIGCVHYSLETFRDQSKNPEGILTNHEMALSGSDLIILKEIVNWEVGKNCRLGKKGICLPYQSVSLFKQSELVNSIQTILMNYQKKINVAKILTQSFMKSKYLIIPYQTKKSVAFCPSIDNECVDYLKIIT